MPRRPHKRIEAVQATTEERGGEQALTRPGKSRRRKILAMGLGVAAASIGGGAALELTGGTALATSTKPATFMSSTAGTPAVTATGTNGADGVDAFSDSGSSIYAFSGASPPLPPAATAAVSAQGVNGMDGVNARSDTGTGVFGQSGNSDSTSGVAGVHGINSGGIAVRGTSDTGFGIFAESDSGTAVVGTSDTGTGITGISRTFRGVVGFSTTGPGVTGQSGSGSGVVGTGGSPAIVGPSVTGNGVVGTGGGGGVGIIGTSPANGNNGTGTLAGQFNGDVNVTGNLNVGGTLTKMMGSFRIDHPLDPAHKYLLHSFVESPDMKNIYDGVVALNADGEAEISLPAWFDALNTEFRYQLTAIGAPGPDLYIAEELTTNHFKIAGGKAGMKVSWQVTGIRQDPWANAHRIPVEQDKPLEEQGHCLHPELYEPSGDARLTQR